MKKWNREKHKYEEYNIPNDWYCPIYIDEDMAIVNCAGCGKKMIYGMGYTSLEIHNDLGLGYIVCEECYEEEWKRR